jgi:transposase
VHEFVPPGHLAHFVRDTVREALDLSAILGTYTEERGFPPYHPGMMVALLLYGYSRGLYSSRQLARACEERVDVMAVTGLNRPDFRTIADRGGSGFLDRLDEWSFCLTAARMAAA